MAAGTVQSVSPVSHTTFAVGPSRAYPSEETQSTSSTPARRGPAAGGAVDRVRRGFDPGRQPAQPGARVGRHPQRQGGHGDPVAASRPRRRRHLGQRGVDGRRAAGLGAPGADQPQRALQPASASPRVRSSSRSISAAAGGRGSSMAAADRGQTGQVLVAQPRPAVAQVHGLEEPVAAQDAQVVAAEHGLVGRDEAPPEHGDPRGPGPCQLDDVTMTVERSGGPIARRGVGAIGRTMIGRCPNPPSRKCCGPVGCG